MFWQFVKIVYAYVGWRLTRPLFKRWVEENQGQFCPCVFLFEETLSFKLWFVV